MWQHPAATQRQTRHPLLQQRRVFRGMGAADTHQQPRQLDRLSVHQFMQRFFTYPLDSNGFRGTVGFMNSTYRIAPAPKLASQYEWDCALCGHETLTRPVFIEGGAGVIAAGTGCAAKALGLDFAVLAADMAAAEIRATLLARPALENAWSTFLMCLPGRVTAKFLADTLARSYGATADEVARLAECYKALAKVGAVRQWATR